MKNVILLTALLILNSLIICAQQPGDKKSAKQVLEQLPEMLIAQPDGGPDSNANKLINDNLSIVIPPVWREQGLHTLAEFKLTKTDKEPLSATFPPQKLTQGLTITMSTLKKTADEKKQSVLTQVKNHLLAYNKDKTRYSTMPVVYNPHTEGQEESEREQAIERLKKLYTTL